MVYGYKNVEKIKLVCYYIEERKNYIWLWTNLSNYLNGNKKINGDEN